MTPCISSKLTIFEGPDGAGKTTAAKCYARERGARYVHFGPLPRVSKNLGRVYVEAMLPALLGYQEVVFDRCWLSELPYGEVFREGQDRLGDASRNMLERLAMRCGAVVVQCDPGIEAVLQSFRSRKQAEMLDSEEQLKRVHEIYAQQATSLPKVHFNYLQDQWVGGLDEHRMPCHPVHIQSAGNFSGRFVLVGESFAEMKDCDAFYQWPFASFSGEGCSQWLTTQLVDMGLPEHDILWVNADQDLSFLLDYMMEPGVKIIALGSLAYQKLYRLKISATAIEHPQSWKRFKSKAVYPLFAHLQEENT